MVIFYLMEHKTIFTIGYENADIKQFLNTLKEHNIAQLVDVRKNAYSWRKEFSKKALKSLCRKNGIDYYHFPRLGISTQLRKDIQNQPDFAKWSKYYRTEILPRYENVFQELVELVKQKPTALLCMEEDAQRCHRSWLAEELAERTGMKIEHLKVKATPQDQT